jgi:hypothetical protein
MLVSHQPPTLTTGSYVGRCGLEKSSEDPKVMVSRLVRARSAWRALSLGCQMCLEEYAQLDRPFRAAAFPPSPALVFAGLGLCNTSTRVGPNLVSFQFHS